ncbi:hypothetical protein D3C84_1018650 [compost metagenome]
MTMLDNAVSSIRLGVEDFKAISTDEARALSVSVRPSHLPNSSINGMVSAYQVDTIAFGVGVRKMCWPDAYLGTVRKVMSQTPHSTS